MSDSSLPTTLQGPGPDLLQLGEDDGEHAVLVGGLGLAGVQPRGKRKGLFHISSIALSILRSSLKGTPVPPHLVPIFIDTLATLW
ncbi:MAG: hypothetical protein Q8O40_05315 [Chloroflexota bacterium]|nr:hypothetical protein [Chloroflexota bacterium]